MLVTPNSSYAVSLINAVLLVQYTKSEHSLLGLRRATVQLHDPCVSLCDFQLLCYYVFQLFCCTCFNGLELAMRAIDFTARRVKTEMRFLGFMLFQGISMQNM